MAPERLESILRTLQPTIQPSPRGPDHASLNHGLHFTGGEPFLEFETLLVIMPEVLYVEAPDRETGGEVGG